MATAISLRARKPLVYAGRRVAAGEYFLAAPVDAASFAYRKLAIFATAPAPPAAPPLRDRDGWNCPAGPPGQEGEPGDEAPPRKKRVYKRRDLQAEP